MYLRTTRRKNKDGSVVEYVQLAHNYRDPDTDQPKPRILFNFGRREDLDETVLRRLVDNIHRFLGPEHELAAVAAQRNEGGPRFIESRPMGGAWLLRGLWDQLDIEATLVGMARQSGVADPEAMACRVWAMVANRALEPLSKHALPEWLDGDSYLPAAPEGLYDEQLYRAMDFLLTAGDALQETVFFACADLINLEVKEVVVEQEESSRRRRYVVIRNPLQAARDRQDREQKLARIKEMLAALPSDAEAHTKAVCSLMAHPSLGRYLNSGRRGQPILDRDKINAEKRLDGKCLVIASDEDLATDDVSLGYKQLAEVERAWRSLKSQLDLRPMHHRKADRIRAHVLICWLALLLIRVAEVRTGWTWPRIRQEMDRLHRGVFETDAGRFVQRTQLTASQKQLLKAVAVSPPPVFEAIMPETTASATEHP